MQVNQQPAEPKPRESDPSRIEFVDVWHTIQGEGPSQGRPAVFIRLAGCNLQCPWCDTDYTSNRRWIETQDLVKLVKSTAGLQTQLVVITGGEPLRQDLSALCHLLQKNGWQVEIETNGTYCPAWLMMNSRVRVICCPKSKQIHKDMPARMDALKYVVAHGQIADNGLPLNSLGTQDIWHVTSAQRYLRAKLNRPLSVYLTPLDVRDEVENRKHLEAAIEACMKHGYVLNMQIHKLCNLP